MRWTVPTTLLFAGCNALFGIHELEPECRIDDDCSAPHTACTYQGICECVAGYVMNLHGCMWSGVVDDPGFAQISDVWKSSGMTMWDATAPQIAGMQDPGQVLLQSDMTCGNIGQVRQTVLMPCRSRAEQLVLSATYKSKERDTQPILGIDLSWLDNQPFARDGFETSRICLGAAHYAPESSIGCGHEISIAASMTKRSNFYCDRLDIHQVNFDHIDIAPMTADDNCPDIGQVLNGDAEGTGGWKFFTYGSSGAQAMIVAEVGVNGSHGVQLQNVQACDQVSAAVPISAPLADATGSPALSFYHSSSYNSSYSIFGMDLMGLNLPLSGSGQLTVERYCIPAPWRGRVFLLHADLISFLMNNVCTNAISAHAMIDDVTVTLDPLCGTDPGIANPGFESTTPVLGAYSDPGKSTIEVARDNDAHGGQYDLRLTVSAFCTSASYTAPVATPRVNPGEGVAVSFWYKTSSGLSAFEVRGYKQTFAPTRDGQWHQGIACLEPLPAGRAQEFFIQLSMPNPNCPLGAIATETAFVDDLAILSTPLCPTM